MWNLANYGFVIDLQRCIGCHACSIACKAEHQIPVGVNRCWVKTVEEGRFPDSRRFFLPVLCNQCDAAPCIAICPTRALFKRRDGVVDLDASACIGCRSCMEACPYDQLFIDPNTRTAEKCNFCANRLENRLQPACVSVCPTECRVFGDLQDPNSAVSELLRRQPYAVRRPEKGTRPKIFYLHATDGVIRPEVAARPARFYREGAVAARPVAAVMEDPRRPEAPRVDYDVPHAKPWGIDMVLYLLTKGISTGVMLVAAVLWQLGERNTLTEVVGPGIALLFLIATAGILVADLERPKRFFYILTRPNWRSWLVGGAYFLTAHGLICALWTMAGWLGWRAVLTSLVAPACIVAVLTTIYTAFLFAQGRGRDLWQGSRHPIGLLAQATAEGSAVLLLLGWALHGTDWNAARALGMVVCGSVAMHLALLVSENVLSRSPTLHHALAVRAIRQGPFATVFWGGVIALGGIVPLVLMGLASRGEPFDWPFGVAAAVLALGGGTAWHYIWVEAGQSVPIS